MIQQDHLQIFDLTLNVWAPLFVGNGSSYTKKEYMYNTRNGKVSFLDEQKFFGFLVEHDLVDKYGQFMLSEQSNLWAFLSKDCGISDAELKTLTRYQIEVGDALDAEHSLKEIDPLWEILLIPITAIPFFFAISIALSIASFAAAYPQPLSPSNIPEQGPVSLNVKCGFAVIPPFAIRSL